MCNYTVTRPPKIKCNQNLLSLTAGMSIITILSCMLDTVWHSEFKLSLLAWASQLNVGTPKPWLWQNVGCIPKEKICVASGSSWVEPFRHTLSLPPTMRHVSVTQAHSQLIDTHLLLCALPQCFGWCVWERITGHLLLMYRYTHSNTRSCRLHHSLYLSWCRWIARWHDVVEKASFVVSEPQSILHSFVLL